jgi:hypothetical protein
MTFSTTYRKAPTLILASVCFLLFFGIFYFFWIRPNQQLNNSKESLTAKEFIELKNSIRTGLAQALGGAALLIGLGFTWRSISATEKNLTIAQENVASTQEIATKNIALALEGQITDRFTKAITQLGDKKLELRLGGIYALERIAKDSDRDYWPIIEILTTFVRENARWNVDTLAPSSATTDGIRPDIQAVLNVIKRRRYSYRNGEEHCIDLHGTDLRNAKLFNANLVGAQLVGTHLEGALLMGTSFEDANLYSAHFDGANLTGVTFSDTTRMKDASFEGAVVMERDLKNAVGLTAEQRATMSFTDLDRFLKAVEDDEPTKRRVERILKR